MWVREQPLVLPENREHIVVTYPNLFHAGSNSLSHMFARLTTID
jgi:hypothetical protein